MEPSKTNHGEITLDLSAAAGPAAGERQEDDQRRQEDRKTDGGGDGWERGGEGRGRDPGGRVLILINKAKKILISIVFQYRVLIFHPQKSIEKSIKKACKSQVKINTRNSSKSPLFSKIWPPKVQSFG